MTVGKMIALICKYSDRIKCVSCGNWVYADEAVGTHWVKESEVQK